MSKPSEYGRLRFCPKCGLERIKRDYYPGGSAHANTKQPRVGTEYICELCGFGFWISKSRRVIVAEMNFARERSRAPVMFTEKCVGPEIARQYLATIEPPMIKSFKDKFLRKLGFSSKCPNCKHLLHKGKCPDSNTVKDGVRIPCECVT